MAVTRLRAPSTTRTPPGVLTIDWQAGGRTPGGDVRVSFEAVDGSGAPRGVQPLGPSRWLVQAVVAPLRVVARPARGPAFPDETVLDLQVGLQVGGRDGGQLVLPPADVSGTREAELLRLVPRDDGVEVVVPAPTTAGGEPIPALPPLARSTVYAARRLAGRDGSLPLDQRSELHVAVDRSASMLPHVRSGARRALLQVLLGVNEVVGTDPSLPVWQLGRTPSRLAQDLRSDSWEAVEAALGADASTEGTAVAPLLAATVSTDVRRLVVVLTDGPPADLAGLEARLRSVPAAPTRWHLLALARSTSDPEVRQEPWRDELSSLAPVLGERLTCSAVTPGSGDDWLSDRLTAGHALHDLLSDLAVWA